ncbi:MULTISPECIES: SDR family oxidoreductase [Rhizobium]|jgi:NADP-dependent 3-hydroxy acid dehydrogenase YdfG|uniref:Serine 3-dehydrogenase n=1 Tax=Rhizobium anhuiense TaxID=1184720 RepID=A0A3S0QK85_9HYPH|nr:MULTISPECIES: SDR family oxidoreductase [Rhizobium]KZS51280.1 oxidoreductase [Rhizobium anhuiense bv. trifolii]MBB3743658.1 NADP-dependent 3-hydroxy acid dehydrogenase YdfG [Rhizobium sp. BK591]MBB4113402.1 NADP-dependent 3-hydroxy acid dehydrogenase YdfG [Rhizobium sp. BK226]MBB4251015.1 NADP-dependent 3-hydroxy acid dehydrogenase YdfG [Rhizobium sp. BK008]NKM55917.1 SDR family NAD(P)-dependent oxidoreductase [Rhizobium anhuiense]
MTNISGKIALVTGASSGIGAATALKLAEAGAKVGIAARRTDKLEGLQKEIASRGGEALVIEMDVVDPASVEAGVKKLLGAYGSIDILVNNAGLMPLSDVDQFKVDEWHRMVDVNVKGLLNTTAAVLPQMINQHSGHIFNMSSIAGRKVFKGLSIYCATKHAVAAFSDGLRMEVGQKHNIRVTCIQPGAVATELYDHITEPGYIKQMDDLAKQMTFLQGEDIGDTIVFAAQAPAHVNVAELFVLPVEQGW